MKNNGAVQLVESNHIFEEWAKAYIRKGYSPIPDKYGKKMPAIKGWSDYCYRQPTDEEVKSWCNNLTESNIAICMGPASGIIALDVDADDQEILDIIMPLLPESPVVKVGAKGETRFFRYTGESTDILKFNGKVVVEILSAGKKTTIPPSLHTNGSNYKWTGSSLLETDPNSLPILPPMLFGHLQSKLKLAFPDANNVAFNKTVSGRNDALSSLCGTLIGENKTVDEVIRELIKFDEAEHEVPLFSDPDEQRHTEPYTNALNFYANHLASINTRRFRDSKEYEIPAMQTVADLEKLKEVRLGKLQNKEKLKKSNIELPPAQGVIKNIYETILNNSWVKQPDLAFGASLALMSTLVSRKIVFQGMSPNLYVLNIAPSGAGKDAPQQMIKNILMDIQADSLLGAGDYVSDASLMNSLEHQPVRLDIMDEAGGILRTVNSSKSEYAGKMADVLAELYTTSNGKYLGRATAEGKKGGCYRPNVNILASTTPTGFSEGVSIKAIEKGLMGRFLTFIGNPQQKAERLRTFPTISPHTRECLRWWFAFNPQDYDVTSNEIAGIPQNYVELKATPGAENRLDEIFQYFDDLRISSKASAPELPIIARLYQQMVKLVILHAASRSSMRLPEIDVVDVEFGHKTILYYFENIKEIISRYIFNNQQEREAGKVLNIIRDLKEVTKTELYQQTRSLTKRQREAIIEDLIESDQIIRDVKNIKDKNQTIYVYCGE